MLAFAIDEVSAVDAPAQQGALMHVVKRADGGEGMQKLDTEAFVKRYIDPADGAVPFSTVMAEEMRCRQYYDAIDDIYPIICAMETSLKSIAGDASVTPEIKTTMARNTVEDFMSVLRRMWSDADVVMMSALGKSTEEVEEMVTKAKTLEQATAQIADLEKKIEEMTKATGDASVNKELQDQVASLTAKLGEVSEELETTKAMSDTEKEYMRSLGAAEQRNFRGMSAAERKKKMGKAADGDETLTIKGRTIRKSVVGEDTYEIFKAQQEDIERAQKAADDEREARQMSQYEKIAGDSYKNLPGTPVEKAKVLKGIESLSEAVQDTLVKMLTAGEAAIKSAFDRVGTGGDGADGLNRVSGLRKNGAQHPFVTKVNDIKKRDGIGHAAAMSKARSEDPEGFADYREATSN